MVMSNRVGDTLANAVRSDARRHAMIADLIVTMKSVSDESFEYVLKVAHSLAVREDGPIDPSGLLGQTRVVINADGTAHVAVVWSFRQEAFLSSSYRRDVTGAWSSLDGKQFGSVWLRKLEDRYQEKLREVRLVALSEESQAA
jgi:hypothetical protein